MNKVYLFISEKEVCILQVVRDKVFHFMNNLHEPIVNLHAIHTHKTSISLKAYYKIFIYIVVGYLYLNNQLQYWIRNATMGYLPYCFKH